MALLHLDGFEGIVPYWYTADKSTTQNLTKAHLRQYYEGRMDAGSSGFHIRRGQDGRTHALGTGTDVSLGHVIWFGRHFDAEFAPDTVIYVGFRVKTQTVDRSQPILKIVAWDQAWQPQVSLHIQGGTRKLRVCRGESTEIGVTASDVFNANTWHYFEFSTKINNTTGTADVKVDGASVLSLSGVDTMQNPVYGNIGGFQFWSPKATNSDYDQNFLLDDIYVLDSTGSANNTFLGPIRIWQTPLVDGTSDFVTYGGGRKTRNISTVPYDQTVGVTSLNTATNKHMSGIKAFHTTGIVGAAIQSRSGICCDSMKDITVKQRVTSGASSDTATSFNVADSESHNGLFGIYGTDPNTSSTWTQTNLNNAEFGVEIG